MSARVIIIAFAVNTSHHAARESLINFLRERGYDAAIIQVAQLEPKVQIWALDSMPVTEVQEIKELLAKYV